MAEDFKVGDVVWIRSGSPAMTVIRITPALVSEDTIGCTWLDGTLVRQIDVHREALTKKRPETDPPA